MMTPLAKEISELPEEELVSMAFSRFARQIAEVVTGKESVKLKKQKVEEIRNSNIAKNFPNKDQQELFKLCDNTLVAIDIMRKLK